MVRKRTKEILSKAGPLSIGYTIPMTSLIVFCAQYLIIAAPLLVAFVFWKASPADRKVLLIRGVTVLLSSIGLAMIGGMLYNDPRPFVVHHTRPLISHVADNGLPSDHTLLAAACGFLILPFSRYAGIAALLVAVILGAARVACQVHTPLDIAGAILMALIANFAAFYTIPKRFLQTRSAARLVLEKELNDEDGGNEEGTKR